MIDRRAQGLTDYAVIIAVVALALLTMQTYFKRGIQSVVKTTADAFGGFGSGIAPETIQRMSDEREIDPKYGALISYHVENSVNNSTRVTTSRNGKRETAIIKGETSVKDTQVPGKAFYQELPED